MKHDKFFLYALAVIATVALASCSVGVLQGTDKAANSSQGSVSISVPPVSSPFQAMAAKAAALANGSKSLDSSSRAIVAASRVRFTYYKDGNLFKNGADIYPNLAGDPGNGMNAVATETFDAGNYQVYVWVYNYNNDSYSPVVSGNAYFTVAAGVTSTVTVTCKPSNPTPLDGYNSEAGSYNFSLYYPWVMNVNGGISSFGTEGWFRFSATGLYTRISVKPDAATSSMAIPYAALYDANGSFVASGASGANGAVIEAITTTGSTYYLGVADFGPSSYSYRPMKVWFEPFTPVGTSNEIMDYGVWKDFVLGPGATDYKTFNASAGVPYQVFWNDSFHGDGTKTKDLTVSGYHSDLSTQYFAPQDSGYFTGYPSSYNDYPPIVTPTADDQVNILIAEWNSQVTPEGTYALKIVPLAVSNPLFDHTARNDWTVGTDGGGIYMTNAASDKTANLNVPTGDYVPGWKFDFDAASATSNGGVKIDVLPGDVHMVGDTRTTKGSNGWGMTMTQDGISFTTSSVSTLDIGFKINSFSNGGAGSYNPYYEAPVKVFLKFNDSWHLFRTFTSDGASAPNESYIQTGLLQTRSLTLYDQATMDGYWIYSGTVIQGVQIQANGWYWDVDMNYIKLSN